MPLIIELHNLAGGLGMCSFLLMNKLLIKRKSNTFVTTPHRKKDRAFNHLVKEGARNGSSSGHIKSVQNCIKFKVKLTRNHKLTVTPLLQLNRAMML